ncbi:MAG: metal ABC transporter ATP-binding protein [Solirubrobacteraceae bacterium]|nr:metal ABC transporter ATP-binding protein [Solirubrobacteraceae bacterium]
MSDVLVQTTGLSTGYAPGVPTLRNVTFAATAGQTIAVLGPNGGGKTTLMRALLGELPPFEGRVETHGEIAYVPQTEDARLDFPVSALDVALMGAYGRTPWWKRLGRSERDRALEALDRVGLRERAKDRFGTLSGGQRQRVLIARALVQDAPILLLDEPFSGVDRASETTILGVLDALRAQGHALLICTHDIEQARGFDRVLGLHGEQTYFGPGAELDTAALERTYGSEIVTLDDGAAIAVQCHGHEHSHGCSHD